MRRVVEPVQFEFEEQKIGRGAVIFSCVSP